MNSPRRRNANVSKLKARMKHALGAVLIRDTILADCPAPAKRHLQELVQFIQGASDVSLRERLPVEIKMIQGLKRSSLRKLRFTRSWRNVVDDFFEKQMSKQFGIHDGIPFSWVAANFDIEQLQRDGLILDLPLHAKIGLGPFSGKAGVEERMILDDAFLFLVKTKFLEAKLFLTSNGAAAFSETNTGLSLNICSYGRMALFSFYSFVECFANSVGEDFVLRNHGLSPEQGKLLRGKDKKDRWLSLESKLEKYPKVINPALRKPIALSDRKQIEEPFKTFVNLIKASRDSMTHFAQGKQPIWLSPDESSRLAQMAATTALKVAQIFWMKCYPTRQQPEYLLGLDLKALERVANQRLRCEGST